MNESQYSIHEWQKATFGSEDPFSIAVRCNEEMAEMLSSLNYGDNSVDIAEECADIVIMLAGICGVLDEDIFKHVDDKMKINRNREWVISPTGRAQHK